MICHTEPVGGGRFHLSLNPQWRHANCFFGEFPDAKVPGLACPLPSQSQAAVRALTSSSFRVSAPGKCLTFLSRTLTLILKFLGYGRFTEVLILAYVEWAMGGCLQFYEILKLFNHVVCARYWCNPMESRYVGILGV
jgi:hypothetical protein